MDPTKIDDINDLLNTITAFPPKDLDQYIPFTVYDWGAYKRTEFDDVFIWYGKQYKDKFQTLQKATKERLSKIGHATNDQVVRSMFFAYALLRGTDRPVDRLERLFQAATKVDVSQYFLVPVSAITRMVRPDQTPQAGVAAMFDNRPFWYGPFMGDLLDTVQHRVKRAKKEHLLSDIRRWEGCLSISRDPRKVVALDFDSLGIRGTTESETILLNYYFDDLSQAEFENFWNEHRTRQIWAVAAGADLLGRESFEGLHGVAWLSIFLGVSHFGGNGTVSFIGDDNLGPKRAIQRLIRYENEIGSVNNRLRSELAETIRTRALERMSSDSPCRTLGLSMVRSRELSLNGHWDEAFLLLIVGIESLLGEGRKEAVASVSRRTAAIIAQAEDVDIAGAKKKIEELYDARSSFVHEGKPISPGLLRRAGEICRQVFFAALRSHAECGSKDPSDWKRRWKRLLDHVHSCYTVGVPVDQEIARDCGFRCPAPGPEGGADTIQ